MNETIKRAISKSGIKNFETLKIEDPKEKLAQDYFMFSYYCSGINFMDFAKIKVSQVSTLEGDTFLTYFRSLSVYTWYLESWQYLNATAWIKRRIYWLFRFK